MADNPGQELLDLVRALPPSGTISINAPPAMAPPPPGIERYARPGVPLDVTTGAGLMSRAGLSAVEGDQNRSEFMRRAYAGSQVDVTDDGNLIIRNVQDNLTGQPKDLLVDEQDFSMLKDPADFAWPVARMALEVFALKKLGFTSGGFLKRVVGGSAVGSAVGQAATATAQAVLDAEQTFGENLMEASKGAGLGMVLGGGLEGAGALAGAARGRLGAEVTSGPTERAGIEALERVNETAATRIIPSIGQMAESPDILNLETFLKRLPFFGARLRKQDELRNEQIRSLQRFVYGETPPQPLADLGADMVESLKGAVDQPTQAAEMATQSLTGRAAAQMEEAIARIAPAARSFTEEGTAALTKLGSRSQFGRFKQVADELFTEAGNPEIPLTGLKSKLAAIEEKLPKVTGEAAASWDEVSRIADDLGDETMAFLLNAAGKPLATETGEKINRDLVPGALTKLVRGLRNLGDSIPLEQLRTVRNSVDNAIRDGRGLEGIETFQLKQISHALTETLEEGIATMPDKAAAAALKRANAFYRENIERFEVPFVARLLKESPQDAGYIGNYELVQSIRSSPDRFRELEAFLKGSVTEGGKAIGANSENVFNVVRRSLLEDILTRSRVTPTKSGSRINADAFIQELKNYPPKIRSTILGAEEDVINRNLDLLSQIKEGFKDVPADSIEAFIRFPANSIQDLSKLATANKKTAQLFQNEVIAKLLKGQSVDPELLRSEQALDWLLGAKNNSDVSEVMSVIADNPRVVESIRQNTAVRLFQDVAQKTKPADAVRLNDLTQLVDPARLIDAMRDPARRARYRTLLGNDTFNLIENFAKSQSVLGKVGEGSLSTGTTATSILTRTLRFFKNVPHSAKLLLYSKALTDPALQKAVMEGSLNPATTDLREWTLALVASPPMLEALKDEFGKAGAELIINAVRSETGGAPQVGMGFGGMSITTPPAQGRRLATESLSTENAGEEILRMIRQN